MKLKFLLFVLFIGSFSADGNNDSTAIPFITEFKWVAFITADSVYQCTRYTDQNGYYSFRLGFTDSTYQNITQRTYFNSKKSYLNSFRYKEGIDTIYSYLLSEGLKSNYNKETLNYKGVISTSNSILEELNFSYIFKLLKPAIHENNVTYPYVRILHPLRNDPSEHYHVYDAPSDEEMSSGVIYEIKTKKNYCCIEFYALGDSGKIYVVEAVSNSNAGIQISRKDSATLKKFDYKRLKKWLTKDAPMSNVECRSPGTPWLLEYKSKHDSYVQYIISDDCLRIKRNLSDSIGLCHVLLSFTRKYFNTEIPY